MKERQEKLSRRGFLTRILMFTGVVSSYGLFGAYALRYLFPKFQKKKSINLFVTTKKLFPENKALDYELPNGQKVLIHQVGGRYIAFSNVCPHLGCKVHFERFKNGKKGFLCPCHMGKFDLTGKAFDGPPAKANQSLSRYPIITKGEAIYIQIEVG